MVLFYFQWFIASHFNMGKHQIFLLFLLFSFQFFKFPFYFFTLNVQLSLNRVLNLAPGTEQVRVEHPIHIFKGLVVHPMRRDYFLTSVCVKRRSQLLRKDDLIVSFAGLRITVFVSVDLPPCSLLGRVGVSEIARARRLVPTVL